jgi:hypothetical protein
VWKNVNISDRTVSITLFSIFLTGAEGTTKKIISAEKLNKYFETINIEEKVMPYVAKNVNWIQAPEIVIE